MLGVSVKLDTSFNPAIQCQNENSFVKGGCVNCSKYFHVDENINVKPNHDYAKYINQCRAEKNTEQD